MGEAPTSRVPADDDRGRLLEVAERRITFERELEIGRRAFD
jgi:hypothetical protein